MARYFTKSFKPDIILGDVSNIIASNKTDKPFSAGDVLFDWQAIDIPRGTHAIMDGLIHMFGEDGSSAPDADVMLLIAKSNSGVAPTSLGVVNAAVTGCFELPEVILGVMKFEGNANREHKLDYNRGSIYFFNGGGNDGQHGPIIIEPESKDFSTQPAGQTQRIYVAGIAGGQHDFSTGVLLNDAGGVADDAGTALTVDGVDPRNSFRPGDVVYIHDVDTPVGTVSSLAANTITLTSNNVGAIADDDEFVNATPITVRLGFEKP